VEKKVCTWWHAYCFDNPLRHLLHRPRMIFAPWLGAGMTALDIGCGMGIFTMGMARMVGERGRVIAVDLQQEMLDVLRRRAERAGLAGRIRFHRCEPDRLGVEGPVDFALAFWSIHEMQDALAVAREVRACLRPEGHFLVAEPCMHVSGPEFRATVAAIGAAGLRPCAGPQIAISRAALFRPA